MSKTGELSTVAEETYNALIEPHAEPEQPARAGGYVYLYHFTEPYKHAGHYMGATGLPPEEREAAHRGRPLHEGDRSPGRPAKLVKTLLANGGDFVIADVWETDTLEEAFELERKFKKQGSRRRLCSICSPGNGRGLGRGKGRKMPVD